MTIYWWRYIVSGHWRTMGLYYSKQSALDEINIHFEKYWNNTYPMSWELWKRPNDGHACIYDDRKDTLISQGVYSK